MAVGDRSPRTAVIMTAVLFSTCTAGSVLIERLG